MTTPLFEVVEPGFLTTVQDLGRPDFAHLGVPRSGAADTWSAAVANVLLGNPPDAAVLECTIVGPSLQVLGDHVVALAGADLGATVDPGGRRLAPGAVHRLSAGDELRMSGSGDPAVTGARAYLAVPGGVDGTVVLGSRATCLVAGFGGLDGRALRAGDVVYAVGPPPADRLVAVGRLAPGGPRWPIGADDPVLGASTVRVLAGPDTEPGDVAALAAADWAVSPASDRRGLRLDGPGPRSRVGAGERLTAGVLPGSVQLPPDGQPIVLLVDAQPTGGYPVVAVVIEADLPVVGQLAPGAAIRFVELSAAEAWNANAARRASFESGWRALAETAGRNGLWKPADG